MRRLALVLLTVGAVIWFCGQDAHAATITIPGYYAGGGWVSVKFRDVDSSGNPLPYLSSLLCGHGSFRWSLDGVAQTGPLYCLDVYHSFHFGNTWETTPWPIPPGPPNPPPFNTEQAAWVMGMYGHTTDNTRARAVQLALWEISHDQQWATNYTSGNWWETGEFRVVSSQYASTLGDATFVLDRAYEAYLAGELSWRGVYYEPMPCPANTVFGQGQLDSPEIPEPGVVALVSLGLVAVGVSTAARRRSKARR